MTKYILAFGLLKIGLLLIIVPFITGQEAYFIGEDYYLDLKDSVDANYQPHVLNVAISVCEKKANKKKVALRDTFKPKFDSIDIVINELSSKKQGSKLLLATSYKDLLENELQEKEFKIDEDLSFNNLPDEKKVNLLEAIRDTLDPTEYLVDLANFKVNPSQSADIRRVTKEEINVQKVHLQSIRPFIISGLGLILSGALILLIAFNLLSLENQSLRISLQIVILFVSIFVTYNIYRHINDQITFNEEFQARSSDVKAKLMDIRKIQLAYLDAKGEYSNNFDSLKNFVRNDSILITKFLVNKDDSAAVSQAKAAGLPLEKEIFVPVKESLFGSQQFDIDALDKIPHSDSSFVINAGVLMKNERKIQAFVVQTTEYNFVSNMNTVPENFDKKKFLQIGSLKEATTEGNW